MDDPMYPKASRQTADKRRALAPETSKAFAAFSKQVFAEGALSTQTKELIAVAVAHVTQCPYCIRGHTQAALRRGASQEQIMEAIWVASEMRAGAAMAHSVIAIDVMPHEHESHVSHVPDHVPPVPGQAEPGSSGT